MPINISGLPSKTGVISDSSYLHLNEAGVDKKVTMGQTLDKISDQYSSDVKNFLGSVNKAEARSNLSIDRRVTVDDANYNILATDKVVAQIGTMSAARTFSLPAASIVEAGAEIIVIDESGSVDGTNKIIVQRNGTDTINGLTSIQIDAPHQSLTLICNGIDKWTANSIGNNFQSYKGVNDGYQFLPSGHIFQRRNIIITNGAAITLQIAYASLSSYTAVATHNGTSNNVNVTLDKISGSQIIIRHDKGVPTDVEIITMGY